MRCLGYNSTSFAEKCLLFSLVEIGRVTSTTVYIYIYLPERVAAERAGLAIHVYI